MGALRPQLSWTHYRYLVKIESEQERMFYQYKAIQNSWGTRALQIEIKNQLYENTRKQEIADTFKQKLPTIDPYEAFKDTYSFGFLGLKKYH